MGDPTLRLMNKLIALGFPVSLVDTNINGSYRVVLDATATPLQKVQAATIATNYIDIPTRKRPLATILADIQALTSLQQTKLQLICIALLIQQNPNLASLVNIAISAEEADV